MGPGSANDYSLAEARERALDLRKTVRDGIDPITEKAVQRAARVRDPLTKAKAKNRLFGRVAEGTILAMRAGW